MIYVALLRGINVGGNNKVEMPKLKVIFEELGLLKVKTYINSGNIIFEDKSRAPVALNNLLEKAIEKNFGFKIKVLTKSLDDIQSIARALPKTWVNDNTMKCDVMFLWEDVDSPEAVKQLAIKPNIDEVRYVKGALLWRVDRDKLTKSGMLKLVATKLYRHMTIRNCNTLRKLKVLMDEVNQPT